MRAWIRLADSQLPELANQRSQLNQAIDELQNLRDSVASEISKN